jgi:hypothetical protein
MIQSLWQSPSVLQRLSNSNQWLSKIPMLSSIKRKRSRRNLRLPKKKTRYPRRRKSNRKKRSQRMRRVENPIAS